MKELSPKARAVLSRMRLLALDVDGCLTDGRVQYVGKEELMSFHVHDGQALRWLLDEGIQLTWITGRGSPATARRAAELGVRELHTRVKDKAERLAQVQAQLDVSPSATVAMGDDLPDLALARHAALFVAPANARPEILERADLVTTASGGSGAVRELAEWVLRARDVWERRVRVAGEGLGEGTERA